ERVGEILAALERLAQVVEARRDEADDRRLLVERRHLGRERGRVWRAEAARLAVERAREDGRGAVLAADVPQRALEVLVPTDAGRGDERAPPREQDRREPSRELR